MEGTQEPQAQAPIAVELDLTTSVKRILKAASFRDNLAKGLHEVCKAIDNSKKPVACFLAENCDEAQYKKLVQALCKENEVPLITVKDRTLLGEWIGLCKYDATMKPRKIRKCSSVVLKDFAVSDEAASFFKDAISKQREIKLQQEDIFKDSSS